MLSSILSFLFDEKEYGKSFLLTIIRFIIGMIFIQTGLGKLTHLGDTTAFFGQLGIPYPHLNALMASFTELVGGTALILGVLTRLTVIPLIGVMIVAILTAQLPEVHSWSDLIRLQEVDYILFFTVLGVFGAGKWSVDAFLRRWGSAKT